MLELTKNVIDWIKDYYKGNDNGKAIIGISGGKDSTVTAKLLVEALGVERVIFVLMPNNVQDDIEDSYKVLDVLGVPFENRKVINIAPIYDNALACLGYKWGDEVPSAVTTNLPSRIRMSLLYAISATYPNSRVVNTCNRSEDYIGYSTKFGDAAGDFSPLANLTVREVMMIGEDLNLPSFLVHKTPSDGMSGATDEQKLGFLYSEVDDLLLGTGEVSHASKERIDYHHRINLHKLEEMPKYVKTSKDEKEVLTIIKAQKEEQEELAKEQQRKEELAKKLALQEEKLEAERKEKEAKLAKEKLEKEAKEQEKKAKELKEKQEKEAKELAKKEKEAKEKLEKEVKETKEVKQEKVSKPTKVKEDKKVNIRKGNKKGGKRK